MVAPPADKPTLADRQRLDEICDAFEQQWHAGNSPSIAEFAARLDGPLAIVGLVELVVLDAFYRGSHDTRIAHGSKTLIQGVNASEPGKASAETVPPTHNESTWQDYVSRFPQLSGVDIPVEFRSREHAEYCLAQRLSTLKHYAAGGLGQILLANDGELKRKVVVKELQPEYASDAEHRKRFLREAEITGQLEHPGIVPVYGIGNHADGEPWYVMRWIEGQNLREAIAACGPWETKGQISRQRRALLHRFADVCNTVHYAHSKSIIHRDIKPSNIVLGDFGETLLVDWGLAKQLGTSDAVSGPSNQDLEQIAHGDLTKIGTVMGTAHYMSPEQAEGLHSETREASDIYSLGATLYQILTGHPPRPCEPITQFVADERPETTIREREHPVPGALLAICHKAMSPKPQFRYATASELAEDIESALADQPIAAFRASWTTTARRWFQKHRTVAAVGIVAAGLMFLTALAAAWMEGSHARILADKNEELDRLIQQEKQARIIAQRSEKRAGDALTYLTTAMQSPDPNRDGRDVRVIDVLHDAVSQMELDFVDDPEMYAKVSYSFGETYAGLGLYQEARDLFEQSVASYSNLPQANERGLLRAQHQLANIYWRLTDDRARDLIELVSARCEEQFGANDPDSLRVKATVAIFEMESGHVVQAVALFEGLQPRFHAVFGAASPASMSLENSLANALYAAGRSDDALALSKKVYDFRLERFGANSLSSIRAGVNYATHLLSSENPGDAVAELEKLLALARSNLGDEHYQTLIVMNALGDCYLKRNDLTRGIPLIEESLTISQAIYGDRHHRTLVAASSLGSVYLAQGNYEGAAQQFENVFSTSKQVRGPFHPDTLTAGNNLASAYRLEKRFDDAADLFQEILAIQSQTLGNNHLHTIRTMINLAATLQEASRPSESIPYAVEAISVATSSLGPEHSMTQTAQSICGAGYLELGQYADAKTVLESCLATRLAKMPDHWLRFNAQSVLGEALAGLQETERAEDLLVEAFQGLLEREMRIPMRARSRVDQARQRLIEFYESQDMIEEAQALRQQP